jgi:alkylation response protein AidB-like acyl-CoA dehydrogenase
MNASFTDEQLLLAETVAALAGRLAPVTTRDLDLAPDPHAWALVTEAGLVGIRAPESAGGSAGSVTEVMIVVEQLARVLCPVPYLGVVCGLELLMAGDAPVEVTAAVVEGRRLPVALDPALGGVARVARSGAVVFDGAGADGAIMVTDDGRLQVVDVDGPVADGADLTRRMIRLPDDPRPQGDPFGRPLDRRAWTAWEAVVLALLSADLVGVMAGALAAAVAYANERVQFDVPIGSFQAIQHLCADAHVLTEAARSATWYAAWAAGNGLAAHALTAARTAKACAAGAAVEVAETAVQVHGGIAITWETLPHAYLRRALLSRAVLGDEQYQLEALATERYGVPA